MNDKQYAGLLVVTPILAKLMNKLYPGVNAPGDEPRRPRRRLLTGVPGLNYTGPNVADLLRLN